MSEDKQRDEHTKPTREVGFGDRFISASDLCLEDPFAHRRLLILYYFDTIAKESEFRLLYLLSPRTMSQDFHSRWRMPVVGKDKSLIPALDSIKYHCRLVVMSNSRHGKRASAVPSPRGTRAAILSPR